MELYDDSFRYFKLWLALHPVVTRAVVPEDLALALVRNRKLHERLDRLRVLGVPVEIAVKAAVERRA